MLKSEFDQIVRENFDLSDKETRQYIATLEDAGQEQLLAALSSALYDQIVSKVDEIDFGTIPLSRGDITKVQGFSNTEECLSIIRNLVIEYKQNPDIVDVVITAISNVKDRKALFIKAYALNVELPMLIYNLIVLSIERSVALMIATCIEYVKDPNSDSMKKALDKVGYKKTLEDTLYKQLISFNNLCKTKTIDKLLEESMKHPVKEDVEFRFDPDTNEVPNIPDAEYEDLPSVPEEENIIDADPFGNDDEVGVDAPKEEPTATEDFPEDLHDDNGNPVATNPDDEELDIEITDDQVEVTPSPTSEPDEAITTADKAITEEEFMREMNIGDILTTAGSIAGTAKKAYDNSSEYQKRAVGVAMGIAGAIAMIKVVPTVVIKVIIPMIRTMITTFYYTTTKFSNYLDVQADFIDSNANDIESGESGQGLSDDKKKKVIDKQHKAANKLRKWANIFALDKKQTENKVKQDEKEAEKNKKKVHKDDEGEDVLF